MRTRLALRVALLSVAVGATTTVPVAALQAPERAGGGYSGWTACSTRAGAKASHRCKVSQPKAAFFRSARHDATYKVCVKFPGKKRRLCAGAQPAPEGKRVHVTITSSKLGTHKVTWYVDGHLVDTWRLEVIAG